MEYIRYNFYDDFDAITKLNHRNIEYINLILNMFSQMFDIENMSENTKNLLMREIAINGSAYVEPTENGYIVMGGYFYGIPDIDSTYPNSYLCTYHNHHKDIKDLKNAKGTVCYVDANCIPNEQLFKFSSAFAQVDTSLNNNIIFSRIAPIISAKNDTVREEYRKVLDNMIHGELENVIKDVITPSIDNSHGLPTTDISNGAYSEKIQYLSMYHEQLISRLAKLYGISYTFISKQANITNDELHNSDDFCRIYPLMYKKNLNECLAKIGLKAEFSKPWHWINENHENTNNENHDNEKVGEQE